VELHVDEALAGRPLLDPRQPVDGDAVQFQAIFDERAHAHLDRARRDDVEREPRRRDRLQVGCVREESEDGVGRAVEALLPGEGVMAEHVRST
jgi:hypothetical protein